MNIARSFANWRNYRRTLLELSALSSRELKDLGIGQADIYRIARESASR